MGRSFYEREKFWEFLAENDLSDLLVDLGGYKLFYQLFIAVLNELWKTSAAPNRLASQNGRGDGGEVQLI